MSNHGFVSSKKYLTSEYVSSILKEINEKRFKNLLNIKDFNEYWEISDGNNFNNCIEIWICSKRKLEMRPAHMDFLWYIFEVFQNELAIKLSGFISNECSCKKYKGNPNYFKSFSDFLNDLYRKTDYEKYPELEYIDNDLIERCLNSISEKFKGL